MQISLSELIKNEQKTGKFKSTFKLMEFSFYACWMLNDVSSSSKNQLEEFFGSHRTLRCFNRIDYKVVECQESILNDQILNVDLNTGQNWLDVENVIGCFINQIAVYDYKLKILYLIILIFLNNFTNIDIYLFDSYIF